MNYKPTKNDIRIIIKIKGRTRDFEINSRNDAFSQGIIDPKLIIQVFDSIENALYESDKSDVKSFFNRLSSEEKKDLSPLVEDAAENRIREYRHNRLLVSDAESGSIEFTTYVVAAAFLVLNNTLKHTAKAIWEESIIHKKLVEFTVKSLNSKTLFIAEKLRRAFAKKKRDIDVNVLQRENDDAPYTIEANIYEELILKELKKPELTLGQVINKEKK